MPSCTRVISKWKLISCLQQDIFCLLVDYNNCCCCWLQGQFVGFFWLQSMSGNTGHPILKSFSRWTIIIRKNGSSIVQELSVLKSRFRPISRFDRSQLEISSFSLPTALSLAHVAPIIKSWIGPSQMTIFSIYNLPKYPPRHTSTKGSCPRAPLIIIFYPKFVGVPESSMGNRLENNKNASLFNIPCTR